MNSITLTIGFLLVLGVALSLASRRRCPQSEGAKADAFHACNEPVIGATSSPELCVGMTYAVNCVHNLAIQCPSFMEYIGMSELNELQSMARHYCRQ